MTVALTVGFVAEGYTDDSMDRFMRRCQKAVAAIKWQPWATGSSLKFLAYPYVSSQEETDLLGPPCFPFRDNRMTHLDSALGPYGLCHFLTGDVEKALDSAPESDIVIVLVNTARYGGSSDLSVAWVSAEHPLFLELVLHELGHRLGLHDEYETQIGALYAAWPGIDANVTQDPLNPPWIHLASGVPTIFSNTSCQEQDSSETSWPPTSQSGVHVFQGAFYSPCDWYRSEANCKMRDVANPPVRFCAYCSQLLKTNLKNTVFGTPIW